MTTTDNARSRPRRQHAVLWPVAGLVALVLLNAMINPAFLKVTLLDGHLYGIPVDILVQGSRTLLVALGMTLVIATGGIDLSVGSLVAIAGGVCAVLLQAGHGVGMALAAAILAGAIGGTVNGILVARLGLQPIVATLILMVAGRGVAQLLVDGQVIIIKSEPFRFLANGFVAGIPVAPLWVAACYVATHLLLRRTALGLFVEAVGDNERASRFAGLAASRIKAQVYVFCGACAGLAGILTAANIGAADAYRAGENMELDAIFAVVAGGTALSGGRFAVLGTAIGALLIQTLTTTMYNLGIPPAIAPVPKAVLIIGVALLQSDRVNRWVSGLFDRKGGP